MAADPRLKKSVGKGRHLSSIKRQSQSEKRNERNTHVRSTTKTAIKQVRSAVTEGNKEVAAANLKSALSTLQKAASKGVIPQGRVSRLSSRLAKAVNGIQ